LLLSTIRLKVILFPVRLILLPYTMRLILVTVHYEIETYNLIVDGNKYQSHSVW
jgi:ABC-type antimicrobial peptide transport system permease subunit